MLCIRYYDVSEEMVCLIGGETDILSLACLLERGHIIFKVSDIATGPLSQKDLGYGGFQCWLPREGSFGKPI